MINLLYPRIYVDSLLDIPRDKLRERNISAFIIDLDNTITEWNSDELRSEVDDWFVLIKSEGFKACILSNNGEQRIKRVADRLGIPFIHRAGKPRRRSFFSAVVLLGVSANEVAVVGDQIFTDVLGGNRAGLFTILVKPLARREFFGTKINRTLELFVLRYLLRKVTGKDGFVK
ncbi:MAG: YqeG family HAD IIIA-type phosphatase [Firmicutes bacterium HGW-Firmicutes-15]|nr:MAG: YqeG family HAD IIIA-type phosphatase [Firmicutes bacterium HGW-Firmicutes-15]